MARSARRAFWACPAIRWRRSSARWCFSAPLVRALQGDPRAGADESEAAIAGAPLKANKGRRDYMRATLTRDAEGRLVATPQPLQDSSLLTELVRSQALLIREAGAPPVEAGGACRILRLPGAFVAGT